MSSLPVLTLSTTAFGEATRCMRLYAYHQRDHLIPLPAQIPPRMRKGTWIHRALQYAGDGRDWSEALSECVVWAVEHGVEPEKAQEIYDECVNILTTYFDYWATQPRWSWDVVACEEPLEVQVSPTLRLRATMDKIVKWRGKLWLLEHKSTSEIPSASWRAIDPQTALQYACATLSGKYQIEGIIFDYLLTREPPVPRITKRGEFYAGTEKQTTTTRAFEEAVSKARPLINGEILSDGSNYFENMRDLIVDDGAFFRRFEVYRPLEAVAETLRDARDTEAMIALSERLGHFRRLNNQFYCGRFCLYSSVCAAEYIGGRRSGLRDSEYMIEDPDDREGRDPQGVPDGN